METLGTGGEEACTIDDECLDMFCSVEHMFCCRVGPRASPCCRLSCTGRQAGPRRDGLLNISCRVGCGLSFVSVAPWRHLSAAVRRRGGAEGSLTVHALSLGEFVLIGCTGRCKRSDCVSTHRSKQ